jgi:DNA-binding CsgD family transcriptional regulator/tetratricopeptide (TPR) repeat protein
MTPNHRRALREREGELSALDTLIAAAPHGGRLALVEGQHGIGKTRLLGEARARARYAQLEVVAARGLELERERAYGVVRQLFEPLLESLPATDRTELLDGPAGAAAVVLDQPEVATQSPAGDPDASFSTLHGLYWFAANLAARRPLVLLIDDVHWCDRASLRWLAYLLPRLEDLAILIVVGTRPLERSVHADVLTHLAADPLAVVLRPAPLTETACTDIVAEVLSTSAHPAFCAACHALSGGNPLWLVELVEAVAAQGLAPVPASIGRLRPLGAQAARRALAARMAHLPAAAVAMAQALAVLADGAQFAQAATLAGLDEDTAFAGVLALQGSDVLATEPPLAFVHPVVRAAVEAQLSPPQRGRAHRSAATLLAHEGAEPERVAAHLLKAPTQGDPEVVDTLREAARSALARGAPESGVAYLARALREPPPEADRAGLLIELGFSESLISGPAAAEHLGEALALLRDPRRRAEVGSMLGRTRYFLGQTEAAFAAYQCALDELPSAAEPLRRLLEAARSHAGMTLRGQADAAAIRACAAALGETPATDLGSHWLHAIVAYLDAQDCAPVTDVAPRAERALSSGVFVDQDNGGGGLAIASLLLMHADRDVRRVLDASLSRAHAHGSVFAFASAKVFRARASFLRGDLRDAEADAAEALEAVEDWNITIGAPYAAAYLADALMEQGRLDEAGRALDRGTHHRDAPALVHLHWLLESRARLRLLQGDPGGAVTDLLQAGARMEALGLRNPAFMPWRSQTALALLALGQRERAAALAADELALARRWGAPRALSIALRALGLAEGGAAGLDRLRASVAAAAGSPARLEHAKALVDLGAALRRANRRVAARDALREGLALATRCAAEPLVERAETELKASGARLRRGRLSGVEALTPSERRVADLAAAGASNREIAQALFVTTKTVEAHLSSAYRKLDIASRAQLARVLAPA